MTDLTAAKERLEKGLAMADRYDIGGVELGERGVSISFEDLRLLLSDYERMRADERRLDFMDEANRRLNAKYGTTYGWRLIMNHNVNRLFLRDLNTLDLDDNQANGLRSCRAAIDERMREIDLARQALKDHT